MARFHMAQTRSSTRSLSDLNSIDYSPDQALDDRALKYLITTSSTMGKSAASGSYGGQSGGRVRLRMQVASVNLADNKPTPAIIIAEAEFALVTDHHYKINVFAKPKFRY